MVSENQKEMNMVIDLQDANILPLNVTKRQVRYLINRVNKLPKDEVVIFKAKLTKGVNLSKVIEQVLYPKYIGKEIVIKVVKDANN